MTEPSTGPFIMHGARDAMAGGLEHIEEQIKSIEKAAVEEPGLALALLAAEAADTIVGFRHRVHRQDRTSPPAPTATFDDNFAFYDSLDEAFRSPSGFSMLSYVPARCCFNAGARNLPPRV